MGILARYATPLRCMQQKKAEAVFSHTPHYFDQTGIPGQKVRLQEMLQEVWIVVGPGYHRAAKGSKKSKMEQVTSHHYPVCLIIIPAATYRWQSWWHTQGKKPRGKEQGWCCGRYNLSAQQSIPLIV